MLVFIIISILILQLLILPFRISIGGHIDFFDNNGNIKVYLFGIRVFKAKIFFEHEKDSHNSIVIKHGKKADQIHINNDPKDKKSIVAVIKNPALENMLISKVTADFKVGTKDNAFLTSLLLGGIRIASYAAMSFLKCRYKVEIAESFTPTYTDNNFEVDFFSIISISLADIIVSLVKSLFKAKPKKMLTKISRA